jgi:hypothetical protein
MAPMNVPANLLSLTDSQLAAVREAAAYMSPRMRDQFLRALGERLGGRDEPGDGAVNRAIRVLQASYRDRLRL